MYFTLRGGVMIKFVILCFVVVSYSFALSSYEKVAALLSVESIDGVESTRPLDTLWACAVVELSDGGVVDVEYVSNVFRISGFHTVRFLLPNEVVNVSIVE